MLPEKMKASFSQSVEQLLAEWTLLCNGLLSKLISNKAEMHQNSGHREYVKMGMLLLLHYALI